MKKSKYMFLAAAGIVLLAAGGFFITYKTSISPLTSTSTTITINIAENTAPNSVLKQLEEQKVIKSSFFSKILMKQKNLSNIKAGIYILDSSWDSETILKYINNASNAESDEVMLTIPEGLWSKDIAKRIAEISNVSEQECLTLWNDEAFLKEMIQKYEFLDESILNDAYHVKLEGYLYPNSYYIYRDTTAYDVTVRLLDGFDTVYQSLKDEMKESEYSIHQIVTFASVIQFESGNPDDMPIISSVFHNRFKSGMKMESSVTVCYALYDKFDNFMDCETNSAIESPYNTYLHTGLPVGPVNNPSIDAMKAVLHPADTDYYYFISDVYGSQKLIPAKTYEEHLKNIKEYLK